jgi:hypothetical protein
MTASMRALVMACADSSGDGGHSQQWATREYGDSMQVLLASMSQQDPTRQSGSMLIAEQP